MKKNEKKNAFCNSKKQIFYCSFMVGPCTLHLKEDL